MSWLAAIDGELGIADPPMPPTLVQRVVVPSLALDGIFVLGKSFILFDNTLMGVAVPDAYRQQHPNRPWIVAQPAVGGLFTLFMLLTMAASGVSLQVFRPGDYVDGFQMGVHALGGLEP